MERRREGGKEGGMMELPHATSSPCSAPGTAAAPAKPPTQPKITRAEPKNSPWPWGGDPAVEGDARRVSDPSSPCLSRFPCPCFSSTGRRAAGRAAGSAGDVPSVRVTWGQTSPHIPPQHPAARSHLSAPAKLQEYFCKMCLFCTLC